MGGTGGWMDGYAESADDLDDQAVDAPAPDAKPPADAEILVCRHCHSDRINPRSSSGDTIAVKFGCAVCGKFTTHQLPMGYRKVYRAIREDA